LFEKLILNDTPLFNFGTDFNNLFCGKIFISGDVLFFMKERISGLQILAWVLGLIAVGLLLFQIVRVLLS